MHGMCAIDQYNGSHNNNQKLQTNPTYAVNDSILSLIVVLPYFIIIANHKSKNKYY